MPFASLLQMLLVAALSLALAWKLGGREMQPAAWSPRTRRALAAIVAFGACAGLLPLQGRLIAMFGVVPLETLQFGLPFLAVTLGAAHALLWAVWPARVAPGVWPAFVSSALVGPLLLVLAWVSQAILGRLGSPALAGAVAGALLLATPVLAWAICRMADRRTIASA
jgi:hypothetical protein